MNKAILIFGLVMLTTPAFATVSQPSNTTNNNFNSRSEAEANAGALAAAGAISGSASQANNSVSTGANNASVGDTTLNSSTTTGGASVTENTRVIIAPPAVAPNLNSAYGTNSVSGGFSTPFGGVSGGVALVSRQERRHIDAVTRATDADTVLKLQGCKDVACRAIVNRILRKYN